VPPFLARRQSSGTTFKVCPSMNRNVVEKLSTAMPHPVSLISLGSRTRLTSATVGPLLSSYTRPFYIGR
jgi:hypothetical protein